MAGYESSNLKRFANENRLKKVAKIIADNVSKIKFEFNTFRNTIQTEIELEIYKYSDNEEVDSDSSCFVFEILNNRIYGIDKISLIIEVFNAYQYENKHTYKLLESQKL